MLSHVQLFVTLWAVAHHEFMSTGFPRKNTGVDTISSSRGLSVPEIELMPPAFSAFADGSFTTKPPGKPEKK